MKQIEDTGLKNLIKKSHQLKPGDDLTNSIIQQLVSERHTELENEKTLTNLLKKSYKEEASIGLSENIVSQLKPKTQLIKRPLVSKYVKYSYGAVMALGIFYLIAKSILDNQGFNTDFIRIDLIENKLILITISIVFLMLFLDVLLKRHFTLIPQIKN